MDNDGNPLMRHVIESIMDGVNQAFGDIWQRPDAQVIAEGFLDGRTTFIVNRSGIEFAVEAPTPEA